jgi:integrase
MSSIQKRGDKWRVFVLVDGKRKSKTFKLKKDAVAWGQEEELEDPLDSHSFRDLINSHREVVATRKGAKSELGKLNQIEKKATFIDLPLEYITKGMVSGYRDTRLTEVAPATVIREMTVISSMFKRAVNDLGWARKNPVSSVIFPKGPPARRRGIAQPEIDALVSVLEAKPSWVPVAQMFLLSIETGMRLGEMQGLTWDRVHEKFAVLIDTKNGDRREVPLSQKAREIIGLRRNLDPIKVFPFAEQYVTTAFIRAKKEIGRAHV